jgi:hypothetical protein
MDHSSRTSSVALASLVAVAALAGRAPAELVAVRGDEDPLAPPAWRGSAGLSAADTSEMSPWAFEVIQSAWSPLPSAGVARVAVAEARSLQWGRTLAGQHAAQQWDASGPGIALWAYDIDASAWWRRSVGAFVSGRVVDDAALAGVQALVADLGGAWRITALPSGSLDLLAGARVVATTSSATSSAQAVRVDGVGAESLSSWTALEGESAPLAGFRSRAELARGVELSLRGDVSPNIDGEGVAWRVGGGVRVKLGAPRDRDAWELSVEAGWRTLDAALLRGLPGAGGAGDERVGAVWVGLSRNF